MDRPFKIGDLVWSYESRIPDGMRPGQYSGRILGFVTAIRLRDRIRRSGSDVVVITYLCPLDGVTGGVWPYPYHGLVHAEAKNKGGT